MALAVAVVAGAALAPGFDEREVTPDDPSVWALQVGDGQRFARVNTVIGEVDTVKEVENPADLAQSGRRLLVYSDNLGAVTPVDVAHPADITEAGAAQTVATPAGTEAVAQAGDFVAYLTEAGTFSAGRISDGTAIDPITFDPFEGATADVGSEAPVFRAAAIAISDAGELVAYSAERREVARVSAVTGEIAGTDVVADGPTEGDLQLTLVGDTWVLFEPATGRVWWRGGDAAAASGVAASAKLQRPAGRADAVILADEFGIVSVSLGDGTASRVFGSEGTGLGEPTAPAPLPGATTLISAWLPAGTSEGTLWRSDGSTGSLDYGGLALDDQRTPRLRTNGSRLILNEARSGWVWNLPSGELVVSSQRWDDEDDTPVTDDNQEVAPEVTDPRAPVAVDDTFGVRAGRQVALPVLLNDHDANKDVLTIREDMLGALDPAFGTVSLADDDQSLVIDVAPGAVGSATFSYAITDGTSGDGLVSSPAVVTVSVKPPEENSAPEWCGVDDCLATWPAPQVNPGGTVVADVIAGWVDPEGDAIYVAGAQTTSSLGVVAASPEGRMVFQHTNANATGGGTVPIAITVSDSWGATADKSLAVTVLDEPDLAATDIALTVTAGVTASVPVLDHVTGATGPARVTEASLTPGDESTVAISPGAEGFTFTSDEIGSHVVSVKVSDGVAEARAVARITVIAPEAERLTTVPVTAFVRAKEDATVDVLKAVSNPGGRVLLISGIEVERADGAQLSGDVVGFSAIRLSGDTASGQPGVLGVVRYTVSDGTGRPEMTASGEVTVVLLGSEVPTNPLAVDDALTVRVGTQADISVLANDVGPAGNVIALDPESVTTVEGAGLAFGSGPTIRYLAPNTPGTYTVTYATYVLGHPSQRDTASLVVTVLDNDTNTAPTPRSLTGRVASGESIHLAFDGTGLDPDGDKVSLRRVETQPASGIASVAADGQSIVYTSTPGFSGQVSFTYSVIDARGQVAEATATVGVIAVELEARPVTFGDYVQAQVGEGRTVVVIPTANDIDLAGGELSLVDLSPDAPLESDEYRDLASRVVSTTDGIVTLSVGDLPGTYSFLYTVRNDSGSTAVGRIVLKAVRERVADVPIIADTVLALDTRQSLPDGVDVLTGKVAWASGDPAGLELSLWGNPTGFTASGWTIAGPVTDEARIIPFQVTGLNFAGDEVTTYGFLRVPGLDETRLALKDTFTAPRVVEGESVTFDLRDYVAVPPDAELVVDADDVEASGVREGSTCELVSGTTLRYSASEGEPYSDMCRVSARVADQDRFTLVPVPITIVPKEPSPILRAGSIELSPGSTTTFDLAGMVTWPEGAASRPVEIALAYSGQQFDIVRVGDLLTITARDRSVPGNVDGATVTLPSDPDVQAVSLTFTVGPAPSALPKGATVTRQCSQSAGGSCTITVVGAPGEVNPLPGTPLEVVSVSQGATCPGVTFSVSGSDAITAAWTPDAPGATCSVSFAVRDAQGRVSAGARLGAVNLDLQGYPAAPAELRQTDFGDGSVTLAVSPSATGISYPAITGFAVYEGSTKVTTCGADGSCAPITGLVNGDKHTYTAKAVNAVGESRSAVSAIAWAYAPPAAPEHVTWVPTRATGGEGKRIDIQADITDDTTAELRITSPNGETRVVPVSGKGRATIDGYFVGSNQPDQVTITPVTRLELPPVASAQAAGSAVTILANGVGKPTIGTVTPTVGATGLTASLVVDASSGGAGSETWIGIESGGACGSMVLATGGTATLTAALTPNIVNRITVCAESRVGSLAYAPAESVTVAVYPWVDPGAPTFSQGYRVSTVCAGADLTCTTGVTAPVVDLTGLPDTVGAMFEIGSAAPSATFSMPLGVPPTMLARLCVVFDARESQCSGATAAVPSDPGYPEYRTRVTVEPCAVGEAPTLTVLAADPDWAAAWTLRDEDGAVTSDYALMRTAEVTVTFQGALAGIDPWTSATTTCTGAPDPSPTPDPSPSVSPSP